MADGGQVQVGEQAIRGRMLEAVGLLEERGAQIILLLCTGVFDDLPSNITMIRPDRLLIRVVSAIMSDGKLGVIVPLAQQIEEAVEKWRPTGLHLSMQASSPYTEGPDQWRAAARKLKLDGAELIVLDCLGFGKAARAAVREETGMPAVLPRTLMARVAAELIE
jgi:protein AroM